ncbi:hypothetical protein SESBI_49584 [Sesbania bispinosa]|nr:hypothetical protein SESBI_49584 [Sesbania bispinosa]
MAENTRLKDLQTEIRTHSEDIRRIDQTMDLCYQEQNDKMLQIQASMDHIQLVMTQLLQNVSQPRGSASNNSSQLVTLSNASLPSKEISLGFPHFDGSTLVMEWIFKVEKFFTYHNTPDASRVDIAAMHFDKDVVPWFQMSQKLSTLTTWSNLTRALES